MISPLEGLFLSLAMGQLLKVNTGERTSAELFKYWQT